MIFVCHVWEKPAKELLSEEEETSSNSKIFVETVLARTSHSCGAPVLEGGGATDMTGGLNQQDYDHKAMKN